MFALGSFFYFSQDCFAVFVIAIVLVERFKNAPKKERGGIKKVFFFTLSQNPDPPPHPPFLTPSVFSDKDFFDLTQIPPFRRKMVKKIQVF